MKRVKRVLLICDLGHSYHRIIGWANFLSSSGWDVHVLTPRMSLKQMEFLSIKGQERWTLHQTSTFVMEYKRYAWLGSKMQSLYSRFHKIRYVLATLRAKSRLKQNFEMGLLKDTLFQESHLAWIQPAVKKSLKVIEQNGIDIILSSTSPFIGVVIANLLNRRTGIPWIVDFRDLWAYNDAKLSFQQSESNIERVLLSTSKCCIVATEPMKTFLKKNYDGPIHTVNNAYSGELLPELAEIRDCPIRVVYTGTVYKDFQDVLPILKCLQRLNQEGLNFDLDIYGYGARVFEEKSEAIFGLTPKFLKLHGMKSVRQTRLAQENAHLLLVLDWRINLGNEFTKLIEYLRTGRYIIASGALHDGAVREILNNTNCGRYFTDEKELYVYFKEIYMSKFIPNFKRNLSEIKRYSMHYQAGVLETILDDVLS